MPEINVYRPEIEKIEVNGDSNAIWGIKSAKSFDTYIQSKINHFSKIGNIDMEMTLRGILSVYKKFHPERTYGKIEIETWKGKSGIIKIVKRPDVIIAYKMQKPDKNSKPEEVKYEITKEQINALIKAIIIHQDEEFIKTHEIAQEWCKLLNLSHNKKKMPLFWNDGTFIWDNFFSWRAYHNKITIILNILEISGMIDYNGGNTKVLNANFEFDKIEPFEFPK
jgi:hypothetical protein